MNRFRDSFVFLASLLVGGTFIVAGVLKSLDVEGFARDIALHGIVGVGMSIALARVLVPFEIVAGAAAIMGYRRRLALGLLIGALMVFIGATGYAWSQGHTEGCGCFGRYAARTPGQVILEDLLLLGAGVLAIVLARPGESRIFKGRAPLPMKNEAEQAPPDTIAPAGQSAPAGSGEPAGPNATAGPNAPADSSALTGLGPAPGGSGDPYGSRRRRWQPILLGALAVVSTAFTLASPSLPIDNLATALRPGVALSDVGLDRIAGNLAEGDRLLVILVLDQPATEQSVPALNALGQQPGVPPITGLTSSNEEQRAAFFWSRAPAFELLEVPAADLRRLYRRAPRTFQVHNGVVLQVWEGIPTTEVFAR